MKAAVDLGLLMNILSLRLLISFFDNVSTPDECTKARHVARLLDHCNLLFFQNGFVDLLLKRSS